MRTEYQIKYKIKSVYKATRKYKSKRREGYASVSSVSISTLSPEPVIKGSNTEQLPATGHKKRNIQIKVSPSPRSNIKELAKAKVRAHQKLIGRLLKEDSLQDRPSLASSRSASPFPASYEL